jgi:5-methyltetrahydropteroyltriglutamate--homocysteine methyltransferase
MHIVADGLPAYFINHACYGAFEAIYPGILELPSHNLDLAISHSALDLLKVFSAHPFTKDLSVGVLDVHSHVVERPSEVKARLGQALQVLPPERVWADPDCGLKTRTVDEARAKLGAMMTAVRELRETLG